MELIEVNRLPPQPPQRAFDGRGDIRPAAIELRRRVAPDKPAVRLQRVADLGRNHDVGLPAERRAEQPLAATTSVLVGGIEERDALVVGVAQDGQRLLGADLPPFAPAQLPRAATNRGHGETGASELTIFHRKHPFLAAEPGTH